MSHYLDTKTGRILNKRPPAQTLDAVFDNQYFIDLRDSLREIRNSEVVRYDVELGRLGVREYEYENINPLKKSHEMLLGLARQIFSPTAIPSYSLYATYRGFRANLPYHVDDNACTYTIDLCLSQETPWPIVIEDESFILEENQAVCYYGEDQYHGRDAFPSPMSNEVEMIFYHFIEPSHWYVTQGTEHIDKIVSDREEYQKKNSIRKI
jgi:hypothetical protein